MSNELSNYTSGEEAKYLKRRIIINLAIAAGDFTPPGEAVSTGATILKGVSTLAKQKGERSGYDLTPDVPMSLQAITEGADLATGTIFSGYALPAILQTRHDLSRLREIRKESREWKRQQRRGY